MATAAADEPPPAVLSVAAGAVVEASDETARATAGRAALSTERWAALAAAVLRDEGIASGELGLRFVDAEPMAELNRAHMGASGPTDVLAFPIDAIDDADPSGGVRARAFPIDASNGADGGPQPPGPVRLLGDVVVCPEYAAVQAADHAGAGHDGGLDDELALLVVHGVLHVLGYDHACDEDAAVMRDRERRLLAAHHRAP